MTTQSKNITILLLVTVLLLCFVTYPAIKPYMVNRPFQIAKDPDGNKQYEDLFKRGAVPKAIMAPVPKSSYEQFMAVCSPIGTIMSVILPMISFCSAIWTWIKKK